MISANYFDSHTGRRHPVELSVDQDNILLAGQDIMKSERMTAARLDEPFQNAPGILHFSDGSHCELPSASDQAILMKAMKYVPGSVERWQGRWPVALFAVAAMVVGLGAAYYWGIPAAATHLADYVPAELEQKMGNQMLAALDKQVLSRTSLSPHQILQAQEIFRLTTPASPRVPLHLEFRSSKVVGPNAFALPGGTIVVTDEMIMFITSPQSDADNRKRELKRELTGLAGAQLAGVLAHEIGHIERRHSLKQLASGGLTAAITGALFGDFSTLAAAAPTLLIQREYSRQMESEADEYAIGTLQNRGISAGPLADLFALLESRRSASDNDVPTWMRTTSSYLASHPQTEQRVAQLRTLEQSETVVLPDQAMSALQYQLGLDTLAIMDKYYWSSSSLSEQRIAQAQEVLRTVAPASADIPFRLMVRKSYRFGPNVVALPGGIIVVTDDMLDAITRPNGDRSGKTREIKGVQAEQLAGLLAREIGHTQTGHLNRRLLASGLKGSLAGNSLSDISTMAAGESVSLLHRRYTAAMQADADNYALALLRERHIPTAPMVTLLTTMRTSNGSADRASGTKNDGYTSMHPSSDGSLNLFRNASIPEITN